MNIVSRKEWGAQHRAGFGQRSLPVGRAYLHHTVMVTPGSPATERAAMRALEQVGQQRFGAGVSYNLVVMPSGRVYEGCGVDRVGAHTARLNTSALGIALAGNYDTAKVPGPMREALVELLRHAAAVRWLSKPAFTGGHRDAPGASTACPGRHAHALLAGINADAATTPTPTPAPPPSEEDDMRYKVIRKADGSIALVAPGYFRHVSAEELAVAVTLGQVPPGAPQQVNDREWDVARAVAVGGAA